MLIRIATAPDAQAIARIHVETWRAAYRGQISDAFLDSLEVERAAAFWLKRLTQARGVMFVSETGGVQTGFCDLIPTRDMDAGPRAVAEIAAIYVMQSHWRKGAGRALCESALSEARQQGYAAVTLWVLASNHLGRSFYEAMGFKPDGAAKTEKLADGGELREIRFHITL